MGVKPGHKLNGKHIVVYDRLWWIQGQRALLLQKYHPHLEIMSYHDFMNLVKRVGVRKINTEYEVISTLGLWTAEHLIRYNVQVHSSVAGSYSYIALNQDHFKEWSEDIKPNYPYMMKVIHKIDRIGAVNQKLATTIEKYCPHKHVKRMKSFVETNKFKPTNKSNQSPFIIGWVGNADKRSKNYYTVYQAIKHHFKSAPDIQFKEATKQSRIERKNMPSFYQSIDLLLVTSANEGLPNPAMEAYACGVPILGTNTGVIKEWASPNAQSLILNSDDPKEFIKKIHRLKTNPKKLQSLKSEIRKNIEDNWTVKHNINDWLNTLFNIGGEKE